MIKEYERFHGAVLTRLVHQSKYKAIEIAPFPGETNASYVINKRVGLYIKHSTSRLSPWVFTFRKEHQNELYEMADVLDEVMVAFVCNDDGLAVLNYSELKLILDDKYDENEWVRIDRRAREKYTISGKDGRLKWKIGENEFPNKLMDLL